MNVRHLSGLVTVSLILSFVCGHTVRAAEFWVDSRFDLAQSHYHGPEEACVVGELIRRTNGYQENSNREYKFGAVYVGPDQGIGEQVCRGVIYGRFFGGTYLPVEEVDTIVYQVGSGDACNLPNYTDPETGQCGPPKCTDECCGACGNGSNPIHTASGNKHQVETDFVGTGQFPLRFRRVYDSKRILFDNAAPMGVAWTHSYLGRVYVVPDADAGGSAPSKAYVYRPNGRIQVFTRSGSTWTSDADVPERLSVTLSGNDYIAATYTTTDDVVETYDTLGRVASFKDRNGFVQTVTYTTGSGSGKRSHNYVQMVTDPQGHTLAFAYSGNQLTSVTDGNGETIDYAYSAGNLISATYPEDGGLTKTRQYKYNESGQVVGNQPHALTGIVDEVNQRFASWGYDASGRANLSVHGPFSGGTIDRTSLLFNSNGTTTVTDGQNQQRVFGFDVQYHVARISALDQPCDYCAGAAKTKGYDGNGYPASALDFRDTDTLYTYNTRGLETQRIEANTIVDPNNPPNRITPPEKRTINTMWNAGFRVPNQRTIVNNGGTTESRTDWFYNSRGQPTARCVYDLTVSGAGSYVCSASGTPPAGIRRWVMTYCDAVNGSDCPLIGLTRTVDGPRTDVADVTTDTYRLTDDPATPKKYRKGDLWKITDALGHVTEYAERDGNGRPTKMIDANGVITLMTYHPRGWLETRTVVGEPGINGGADATTTIDYDDVGNVTRITQPDGAYLDYGYDLAHRLTTITDNFGNSVVYTLDALGNRSAEQTFASGDPTPTRLLTRTYNALNRLTDQYDAQVRATQFAYDGNGNRTERTDPTTVTTQTVYDPLNRLKSTIQDYQGSDPSTADAITAYAYDTRDNLTQVTDPDALATNYTYDGLDDLDTLASPDTGSTDYVQDAAGNRTSQTDARGVTTNYQYDALNRLTLMTFPTVSKIGYSYDQSNSVTGCAISYPVGRLTSMSDPTGSTTYCYDHRGNVIQKTQVQKGGTYVVGYAYDLADRLSAIDYPDGARVEYTRDALGRLIGLQVRPTSTGALTPVVSSITWQPFGPPLTYTFASGSQSLALTYDQNYWLTDVAGSVLNLHFCRDSVADITRLTAATPACTSTPLEQYTYDNLYRLSNVEDGSGSVVEAYSYNLTGDRLSKTEGTTTTPYGYDMPFSSHHLLSVGSDSRDYDDAGNLIDGSAPMRTYSFDDRNRLVNYASSGPFGGGGSYDYNGRGERVFKDAAYGIPNHPDRAHYVYDEAGMLLTDHGNGNLYPTDYIYADGRPVALVRDGTIYYVHSDQLGTPRAVTAAGSSSPVWSWTFTGNPFGEQSPTGSFRMNLRFPGQYADVETGFNYNYYRDYEPTTGRYVESDPIGLKGGLATYDYTGSSPIVAGDVYGMSFLFPGPRPDYTPCAYYDGMYAKTHCCYYHLAARTCRGNNRLVNAWLFVMHVGAGQSNCIRSCLVKNDKQTTKDCHCGFGSTGICNKPSCIDAYHNKCYSQCGAPRFAYGGNLVSLTMTVQLEPCY